MYVPPGPSLVSDPSHSYVHLHVTVLISLFDSDQKAAVICHRFIEY